MILFSLIHPQRHLRLCVDHTLIFFPHLHLVSSVDRAIPCTPPFFLSPYFMLLLCPRALIGLT